MLAKNQVKYLQYQERKQFFKNVFENLTVQEVKNAEIYLLKHIFNNKDGIRTIFINEIYKDIDDSDYLSIVVNYNIKNLSFEDIYFITKNYDKNKIYEIDQELLEKDIWLEKYFDKIKNKQSGKLIVIKYVNKDNVLVLLNNTFQYIELLFDVNININNQEFSYYKLSNEYYLIYYTHDNYICSPEKIYGKGITNIENLTEEEKNIIQIYH